MRRPSFDLHRASIYLASIVGSSISWKLTHGGFDLSEGLWTGIALLGVVQLHLLTRPQARAAKADA